jgi:hypothetical protein
MRVEFELNVGNMTLVDYVDDLDIIDGEISYGRQMWESLIDGRYEPCKRFYWGHNGWEVLVQGETAQITFGMSPSLKVEIPLVLLKTEMGRVLDEYDAAVAAETAATESEN